MIGIIGAMEIEVEEIKRRLKNIEITTKANMQFNKGNLNGQDVVVVRSGIGKVNAALCTQILIDDFKITKVINTGVAGSLNNKIDIGDMVISTDALQHDMDATGFGYDLGVIPQMDVSIFRADNELREIAVKCCENVNKDIKTFEGRIVSGDQFISDKNKKDWLIKHFAGYCAEMEGAAIAQAAYLNNIPFLIIRAISDKADDSATMDYPEFEKKAASHSVNLLVEMCKLI